MQPCVHFNTYADHFSLLRAAALATSCKISLQAEAPYYDLHQNEVLGMSIFHCRPPPELKANHPSIAHDFVNVVGSRYGMSTSADGTSASTDFVS